MAGSTPTAKLGLRSSPVSGSRSWEGHWGTTGIPLGCTHRQHEDASNRANMIKNTKVGGALYVMLYYVFLSHCMLCHVICESEILSDMYVPCWYWGDLLSLTTTGDSQLRHDGCFLGGPAVVLELKGQQMWPSGYGKIRTIYMGTCMIL